MKALVNTAPGKVEMQDLPAPSPGKGEVRIKTAACAICATDLEMIEGCKRSRFSQILGHEWSGIIDAAGEDTDARLVGSPCVAENVLTDGGEVGFERPGGYAEYFITEAKNIHVLPADYPLVTAALIEPLAVAVRGFKRLRIEDRNSALIFGDGPIGLIMLMLLKRGGVKKIVLVGGRARRLDLAAEFGATHLLNYHDFGEDLATAIAKTSTDLFANVIEASGSAAAMRACLDLAKPCGHILMLGDYGTERASFPWLHFLQCELELIGSNASAGAWPEAVDLAVSGEIPLHRLATHVISPGEFEEGLNWVRGHRGDVLKVILDWSK